MGFFDLGAFPTKPPAPGLPPNGARDCMAEVGASSEPMAQSIVNAAPQWALVLTALLGIFVAWRIPQMISRNEQRERKEREQDQAKACAVSLQQEFRHFCALVGFYVSKLGESARQSDENLGDDQACPLPDVTYAGIFMRDALSYATSHLDKTLSERVFEALFQARLITDSVGIFESRAQATIELKEVVGVMKLANDASQVLESVGQELGGFANRT